MRIKAEKQDDEKRGDQELFFERGIENVQRQKKEKDVQQELSGEMPSIRRRDKEERPFHEGIVIEGHGARMIELEATVGSKIFFKIFGTDNLESAGRQVAVFK